MNEVMDKKLYIESDEFKEFLESRYYPYLCMMIVGIISTVFLVLFIFGIDVWKIILK